MGTLVRYADTATRKEFLLNYPTFRARVVD